ncbi:hypothetical protein [Alloactinosynnema sp. L-07]|uniref:DUF4192 domain-containing protein n=1 Tax=Alloactinosynnema sp. L-07 TaxID=1653480 RepID=UPI00065EFC48|nr:DUF4192 domain-containing protein [Alloactinosynnema sp. L-07]CRK59200.1 hypothetical protein [Alloactinosynnema sp. L-07]
MPDSSDDTAQFTTPTIPLGELIAAMTTFLGYPPVDSLLVYVVDGPCIRVDLPAPEHCESLAAQMASVAAQHGHDMFVMVIGGQPDRDLPHRGLVESLTRRLKDLRVTIHEAVWSPDVRAGARWVSYTTDHRGVVPDPDTTLVAVHAAYEGIPKFSSRADMAASLAPDPAEALRRRAELITQLRDQPDIATEAGHDLIKGVIAATNDGTDLDDDTLARVARALDDPDVRGWCLVSDDIPRDRSTNDAWARLVRALPAPERSFPACLLAIGTYLAGEGALTQIAQEIAVTSDPDDTLAPLLGAAFQYGISPREMRAILRRART